MTTARKILAVSALTTLAVALTACAPNQSKGQKLESQQQSQDQTALLLAQPLPHFNYSQIRQNLKEIETAEANGVETTSFFFNLGVRDPIQTCPSIGAPIPTTDQLSNPNQVLYHHGDAVLSQMDPTGVYTGDSTGTYVLCVGADGKPYAEYWEGYVSTAFGPAKWNEQTHMIELVGPPSYAFSKSR